MSQSKKLSTINNSKLGRTVIKYATGGEIPIDGDKSRTKDKRSPKDSVVVNPIKELGHFKKRVIPTNTGSIPYSKSTDPEYNNARKDFVDWYSNPATAARFEKNTRYDPERLKDFVSKGTAIPAFKGTAQKQPPVGSKAVFNTPDVNGQQEEIVYHSGVGSGVIQHELTHASALANVLGPSLLRVLGSPKNQKLPSDINDPNFKSTSNTVRDYMSIPSEAYGNFHEFRVKLGLKPGEQINRDQLRTLVKEKNLNQENFFNTFEDDNIVNAINTIADNNKNDSINYAAMGGYLRNTKYALGGELTQFNEGGTHEQNPNGGIPLGQNASVEQGETKMSTNDGQFIFSDRIQITPDVASALNLPKSWVGKSMSDYSKKIDKQFKDRTDTISRSTKQKMLDRGAEVQEAIKAQQEALMNAQNMNANQAPEDMMNGQIPAGAEEYMENAPMAYGGRVKMFAGGVTETGEPTIVTNDAQIEANKLKNDQLNNRMQDYSKAYNAVAPSLANSINNTGNDESRTQTLQTINNFGNSAGSLIGGKTGSTVGSAVTAATGLYDMGSEAFGRSNVDTSGMRSSSGASAGKSAGAGALKGAGTGAALGSIIPGVGTLIGAAAGAVVGGVTGFIGGKKDEKAQVKNNNIYSKRVNSQFNDVYARGGKIKTNPKLDPVNSITPVDMVDYKLPDITSSAKLYNQGTVNPTFLQKLGLLKDEAAPYLDKASDKLGNALRYAPLAMDAYQLSKLRKPEGERLDRLSNRYIPRYTDMAAQQNIVNQELNNVSSAIQGSGASQGAVRANLLGAQLNKSRALSQAYADAESRNAQQDSMAQQFNLGVDSTNLNQSNTEKDINARNLGAYETQKSRLLGNIGTTAGEIGKEEKFKDITKQVFGYDSKGRYVIDPNGDKRYISEKKSLGGYLLKNKRK